MLKRLTLIVALGAALVACGPGTESSPSLPTLDVTSPSPSGLEESPSGMEESPSGLNESPSGLDESPSASPS